ncbi:MAG: haloacid dehalogenase-like hydrolase [Acidimicrobiia bacterium]
MSDTDYGPVPSNKIAFCWDADGTLLPGYMQTPMFEHFGVDEGEFWEKVNAAVSNYRDRNVLHDPDNVYLNMIVADAKPGRPFAGLTNSLLRELGSRVRLYPSVLEAWDTLADVSGNPSWRAAEIQVEHYVISTGLRQMILGTELGRRANGVWGGEFEPATDSIGDPSQPIEHVVYAVSATLKTQILYAINKGSNIDPSIDVDRPVPDAYRRVPFQNIVYTGDSKTDVPAMSVTARNGGFTVAVWAPGSNKREEQSRALVADGRAKVARPADFGPGSALMDTLIAERDRIADRIVAERAQHRLRYHGTEITHHNDNLQAQARNTQGGVGR